MPEDEVDVTASDDDLAADDAADDGLDVMDDRDVEDADEDALDDDLDSADDVNHDDDDDDRGGRSGGTMTKARPRTAAGSKTSLRKDVVRDTKRPSRKRPKRDQRSGNIFVSIVRFIREVVAEMRKVLWPTRRELGIYTVAVIIFVAVMIAIVGALDYGFARLVLVIFG